MRHKVAGWKLGRNTSHRRSLLRNLVTSLILEERIETTVPKAKALRPLVEKMITLGKRGDLSARRQALAYLSDRPRMLRVLHGGRVKQALTPIHPGGQFYTSNVNLFEYDLKKAEDLLDAAGHKRGPDGTRFRLTLDYLTGAVELTSGVGEFLRGQFKPPFPAFNRSCSRLMNGESGLSSFLTRFRAHEIEKGLISSFPIRTVGDAWEIVQNVSLNDFSRRKIDTSVNELKEERELVEELLG